MEAPSPGRQVSHLAPPGAAASTRPTAGRMVGSSRNPAGRKKLFSRTGGMWTELAQPIREQNGQVEQTSLRGQNAPGGPFFSVCGEIYGQTQKRKFKLPKIVIHSKGKDRFSAEKRSFLGAAGRIRTADLILTKRLWSFFLTIFRALWPFSLHFICFPALFEGTVSIYSTPLCG